MRKIGIGLLVLLSFVVASHSARAGFVVLGAETTEVRIVVAPASDRTTRWYSVSVEPSSQGFFWVIPASRGAAIDIVSNAWIDALDMVTAPRVVSSCGGTGVEIVRGADLGANTPGETPAVSVASDAADLDTKLDGQSISPEVRAELHRLVSTHDLVVVRSAGPRVPTIRIVDRESDLTVPMPITGSPRNVDVTAFVLAGQRASLGRDAPAPSGLRWFFGKSNYLLQRDTRLAQSGDGSFITESAVGSSVLDEQRMSPHRVPSLAFEYFTRASLYGDASASASSCTAAAVSAGASPAAVQCASANAAGTPLEPCMASTPFACGSSSDDLALAVSSHTAKYLWITRFIGRMSAHASLPDLTASVASGNAVPALRVATGSCGGGGGGSPGPIQGKPTEDPSYHSNSESCSGSTGTGSGTRTSSSESCSGDTQRPPSSGSSGDDCDSSDPPPSESEADDCESDEPSDTSGEDCDWDETEEDAGDGSDDSCATDESEGEDDCESTKKPKKSSRSPLSRIMLAFAAVLLPLRRWGRRKS